MSIETMPDACIAIVEMTIEQVKAELRSYSLHASDRRRDRLALADVMRKHGLAWNAAEPADSLPDPPPAS
jgi:hypothetical protein